MRSSPFQCFGASPSPKRLRHWARRDARASRCLRFGSARSAPLGRPAASSCAAIRCIRYLRRVVPRSVLSRNARASAKACATDGGGVCLWARRAKVDVAQVTTSARSYRQGQLADDRRLASLRSEARANTGRWNIARFLRQDRCTIVETEAAIAQLVARRSHNPKVVSSILTRRISRDAPRALEYTASDANKHSCGRALSLICACQLWR